MQGSHVLAVVSAPGQYGRLVVQCCCGWTSSPFLPNGNVHGMWRRAMGHPFVARLLGIVDEHCRPVR